MEETLYIAKNRSLPEVQDYDFLRTLGLRHIEDLSSKIWTDYNTHDPGITTLEALCYAITELGYRTGFDIKNLLAGKDGNIATDQAFFSPKSILTAEPLTIEDYRKLLVDIAGVKNAWLFPYRDEDGKLLEEPEQEVLLYAHCQKDQLVYEETEHPVRLHGLYCVLLDLEETDEFGDLNKGDITYQFATEDLLDIRMQLLLPGWKGAPTAGYEFIAAADPSTISNIAVSFSKNRWTVKFEIAGAAEVREFLFQAFVLLREDVTAIEPAITDLFNDAATLADIFSIYQKKNKLVVSILQTAKQTLHAHRNLCEDFVELDTVCTQEVAFCADIEVTPDADIEEVYANILYQLQNYLNPDVPFYSLKELLEEGLHTDEIFEGPILTHGFIKTEELKATQLRSKIYVSDVINFIMDTAGVLSVKNVLFTKYNKAGEPVLPSERWCLEIGGGCKPVLNVFRSKVLFFKGKLPFRARVDETLDTLKYLNGLEQRKKLKGTADDLELPQGAYHDLGEYLSVQYEFPVTYGIGEAGLPSTSTPERVAQAKQLKAYLMFYDQLLGNFFAQLSRAKDLFSLNTDVNQTYFAQFLSDIKGMEEIYGHATDLEKALSAPAPADTDAIKKLRALILEDSDTFYDRRNRFLDHLIGRFAESFNEYVLMLYTYKNADSYQDIEPDELIKDKISFLKDYPQVSRERGKAFNYLQPSWDSDNVSGLEKRIARLSGIDDFTRRFLFCLKHIEILSTTASPPKYFFNLVDEAGTVLLTSLQEYASFAEVKAIADKLPEVAGDSSFYKTKDLAVDQYSFLVQDSSQVPLAKSGQIFTDAASRNAAMPQVAAALGQDCPGEGMHLVEHLLLRPRFEAPEIPGEEPEAVYKLFQVCLGENCGFCGEEDPYSFRLSLVLPYWHERFKSMEFRRYFESMVRTETPAHCMIKICWVSNTLLNRFERIYQKWMETLADYEKDLVQHHDKKEPLRKASNDMIAILKELHSEYPEAHLHDCATGVSNPVLLGNTVLGTYKF
ncbi:hypothetical protein [Botryobacter ruber]|uniref:hypothetical protein n=1 Tax=Botryobacter ruber TaxID=2171629 RepID=UPI000E0AE729|nr:hypothetical protein [Botryobacter ruber]